MGAHVRYVSVAWAYKASMCMLARDAWYSSSNLDGDLLTNTQTWADGQECAAIKIETAARAKPLPARALCGRYN